jgi:two-component system NarL family sensor kinase
MSRQEQDTESSMKGALKAEALSAQEIPKGDREAIADLLSHDLKTPLIGSSQLINLILAGSAGELNPELVRLLKLIQQTNSEVLDLVQGVLEIYRYDGDGELLTIDALDLMEVLLTVQESLAFEAKKGQPEIDVFQAMPPIFALADRRAVLKAVTMLVSQLIRVRSECTKVVLKARPFKSNAIIEMLFVGLALPVDCLSLFAGDFKPERAVPYPLKPAKFAMHAARHIIAANKGAIDCRMLNDQKSLLIEITLPLC